MFIMIDDFYISLHQSEEMKNFQTKCCYTSPSGDSVAMAERNLNGYLSRGLHHTWLRLLGKNGSGPCRWLLGWLLGMDARCVLCHTIMPYNYGHFSL